MSLWVFKALFKKLTMFMVNFIIYTIYSHRYAYTSKLTKKADIYSFGVVLLETICGLPPIIKDKTQNIDIHIVEWV